MKAFTIDGDNNIIFHATLSQANAEENARAFATREELNELATEWPTARLIEIWNSLPGVTPVKKFKDRATAIGRIWLQIQTLREAAAPVKRVDGKNAPKVTDRKLEALQNLAERPGTPHEGKVARAKLRELRAKSGTTVDTQAASVPPETKSAAKETKTPSSETKAKNVKQKVATAETGDAAGPKPIREGSKMAILIDMLRRPGGVTLQDAMAATEWLEHTTRAFMAATLPKRLGVKVISENVDGKRTFRLPAETKVA